MMKLTLIGVSEPNVIRTKQDVDANFARKRRAY